MLKIREYLIIKYDEKVKEVRMKAKRGEAINNIQHVGICVLKINEILNEKKMSQVIRITDTKQEIDYSVSKIKNQQSYINLKVRNYILVRVLVERIKYIIRYNYYEIKDRVTNDNNRDSMCL